MKVRLPLPAGHEAGFRSSLVDRSRFAVDDLPGGWVAVEPGEGSGEVASYFTPYRLGDADTDFSLPAVWQTVQDHPPWSDKPDIPLAPDARKSLAELQNRDDILSVSQRLGAAATQADAGSMAAVFQKELPRLFELYPQGSLWYIAVDLRLVRRLAFMRVRLQLTLTPDIQYDPDIPDRVQYFGMHTTTSGSNFGNSLDHVMLAFPPAALGFDIGVLPHAFAFLFGAFEDLRLHRPVGLSARFFPSIGSARGIPGVKVPVEGLDPAHLESLLGWWTTRLNVVYSYAADPTNFPGEANVHDVAAQAAWFFTLERMMADAAVLLAAVDAPAILRMQAAFDFLDKADSLLTRGGRRADGTFFRRLLLRGEALPRLGRAFERMPLQLRPRFKQWARESYDRFYEDIKNTTMASRRQSDGVLVANRDPARPARQPWDEYVARLMRAARNSSHGLREMLSPPDPAKPDKPDPRLLLATNSGNVPYSFYEVVAVVFLGLMADAERLCDQTWWSAGSGS